MSRSDMWPEPPTLYDPHHLADKKVTMNDTQEDELKRVLGYSITYATYLNDEAREAQFEELWSAIQAYVATKELEARRDELNLLTCFHLGAIEIDVFGRSERSYNDRLAELTSLDPSRKEK